MSYSYSTPIGLTIFGLDFRRNYPLLSQADGRYQSALRSIWKDFVGGKKFQSQYDWSCEVTASSQNGNFSFHGTASGSFVVVTTLKCSQRFFGICPSGSGLPLTRADDYQLDNQTGSYTRTDTGITTTGVATGGGFSFALGFQTVRRLSDNALLIAIQPSVEWSVGIEGYSFVKFDLAAGTGTLAAWNTAGGVGLFGGLPIDATFTPQTIADLAGETYRYADGYDPNGTTTEIIPNGGNPITRVVKLTLSESYSWQD